jgi:hypothetical protein
MTSFLNKLNLRPNELRLVVVVALVIIAVLYALFIVPEFKEWGRLQEQKRKHEMTRQLYEREIEKTSTYQRELAALKEKHEAVDSEKQALDMQRTVNSQAALNAVTINVYTPGKGPATTGGKTNAFFEEVTGTINFVAEENALVSFLYALSSGNSLIRVASMTLNPDPGRMKLMGNMTLVASYPKKAAVKAGSSPAAASAGARPSTPAAGPKSISAAVRTTSGPAATNASTSVSLWGKVKNLFSSSKSAPAPAAKPAVKPGARPAPTNAPPARKK